MSWFSDSTVQAVRTLWKWKWTFLVPIATLVLPATIYALRLPKTYKATAIIQINEKYTGGSGVLPGTRDKTAYALVNQARDRLLTSENMKPVVPILAPGANADDLGVLQAMAKDIEFDRIGDNAFSVSVIDVDPVVASRAAQTVSESFINNEKKRPVEEARLKKDHAQTQLARAKKHYKDAVEELNDFRDTHSEARGAVQDNLRNELRNVREALSRHRQRRDAWQTEREKIKQELAGGAATRSTAGTRPKSAGEQRAEGQLTKILEKHEEAVADLQGLLGSKTESHPKVISARHKVRELAKLVAKAESNVGIERAKADKDWAARTATDQAAARKLKEDRAREITADIDEATRQITRLTAAEKALLARLEKAPGFQDEMAPLLEAKNLALKKVEESQKIASTEEAKYVYMRDAEASAVTPFAIIQPAEPPMEPHGPRRMKWLVLAVLLGAGIGYGLMLLRRRFERANVMRAEDIAGMLPGALIVPVPRLEQAPLVNPAHMARDVVMGAWVFVCLGLSVMAVATHRNLIEGPDWLRAMIGV